MRRFRSSLPNTNYFVTLCTRERCHGLTRPETAAVLSDEIARMERDGYWIVHGAVIMPDHLHLLLRLLEKSTLGRAVARLKSKSKPSFTALDLRWQGNYYEHRLRPGDSLETALRYIYLNPYRASLVARTEIYQWFWLGQDAASWFDLLLDDGLPYPAWLD